MSCEKPYRSGEIPTFSREVCLTNRGMRGVERKTISLVYSKFEVDGVGVSRVKVGRGNGLDMSDTADTTSSFCFFLLIYTSPYLDSPLVCFVQDNRPNVGKLNLRAVKYIFVGYSSTQKGYVC
jgi:hypothetical protein